MICRFGLLRCGGSSSYQLLGLYVDMHTFCVDVCMYVGICVCHGLCVEVRGQHARGSSVSFYPVGPGNLTRPSGWQPVHSISEPSHQPHLKL